MSAVRTSLTEVLGAKHAIINAPMCGFAMGTLAGEVAKSGGVGVIGIGAEVLFGPDRVREEYEKAVAVCGEGGVFGFGLLQNYLKDGVNDKSFQACLDLNPRVMWLSFGEPPTDLVKAIRERSPSTKIIIQIFTVKEALEAAPLCDILVIQGCDAGGHGRQNLQASLVTLLPQVVATVRGAGFKIPIVGAGGIIDGRGMAAALSLGADGIVMGSRFVVVAESGAQEAYKKRVLECTDGIDGTAVSEVWDYLSTVGEGFLRYHYMGRALSDSEALRRFGTPERETTITAADKEWYAKASYDTRAVWCSSSSGMINTTGKAGQVVEDTVREAIAVLQKPTNYTIA